MNMIIAGIKKEALFFWRGFRLGGVILVFLGFSLVYPAMDAATSWFFGEFYDYIEIYDVEELIYEREAQNLIYEDYSEDYSFYDDDVTLMYYFGVSSFMSIAMIVTLMVLREAGGGEQKKRSIIIPQTAGLTPAGYVLPKFIFYPTVIFIITLFSSVMTNVFCFWLVKQSESIQAVMLTGTMAGVYITFHVCLYLFLGISTGRPGLSVLYVLIFNWLSSFVVSIFEITKYTPWSLESMVLSALYDEKTSNFDAVATIFITLLLSIILMAATLFVVTAKRVDNTADEVY